MCVFAQILAELTREGMRNRKLLWSGLIIIAIGCVWTGSCAIRVRGETLKLTNAFHTIRTLKENNLC